MFFSSYNFDGQTLSFAQWPNGKSYLEQDNYLVTIFRVIKDAVYDQVKVMERNAKMDQRIKSGKRR
jgi:hypothetical protein